MKPLALISAAAVIAATCSPLARADGFALGVRDRNVAIGVQLGDPSVAYVPAPVVGYAPRPYYPPRYYAPPAAVYPSGYWIPHRYYGERYRWDRDRYYGRDEWRHHRWHDDDRWRRGGR